MYLCKSALNFAAGETASATTAAVSAAAAANLAADILRDSSRLDVSSSIGIQGFRSSSSSTVTIVGFNSSPVTTPTNITSNQRTKLVCSLTNMAPTACSHVATGPVLLAPVEDIAVEAPSTLLCLRLPCSGITSYSSVSHGLSSRGLSNEFELSCDP